MDNLRKALAYYGSCFWLHRSRRRFTAAFDDAIERVCHQIAASRLGDSSVLCEVEGIIAPSSGSAPLYVPHSPSSIPASRLTVTAFGWLFVCVPGALEVVVFTGSTHLVLEWLTFDGL